MAIVNYVEQILSSPVCVFDGIIQKLIGQSFHHSNIELSRYTIKLDATLIESIKSILKDLKQEEGMVSRFLYAKFGFEVRKNKRREQLLYLGSELKTQHRKIKARLYSLNRQKERVAHCSVELRRLHKGFKAKAMSFENKKVKNKNKFYLDELEHNLSELEKVEVALSMRYDDLFEIEKIYDQLFQRIPRCERLEEESYLLLAQPIKV
ncbi:MAG: Unknown protein [uncultured Sulfurovum sp.]|uniref:Uncharacterized protein n=1 Tax=uncultured Sulfurovum sp. TaxID=269237 RepID=A0A6S6SH01_9BACT|nr:MAG: Unknown protein [uncultured Sulfurovum sp.]